MAELSFSVLTNQNGEFSLSLSEGTWVIFVTAPQYLDQSVAVEIGKKDITDLEILLYPAGQFSESIEVRGVVPRREEASASEVEPETVLRVAGGLDNIFRTIQTLPGVSATEDFGSRLSVRGGEPDQNLTIMDGVEISNPYRVFGLTSAFNPETVDQFELTAGGFSAKYGDRLSSILIVNNRSGRKDKRLSGSTSASITDANVILEGSIPSNSVDGSWLLTARRTYYDLVAERIVDSDLPSFGDLQLKLDIDTGPDSTLSIFGLRSREDTDFAFTNEEVGEFAAANDASNNLASVSYDTTLGLNGRSRSIVSWYKNQDAIDVDANIRNPAKRANIPGDDALGSSEVEFDFFQEVEDLAIRQEFSFLVRDTSFIETGFEFHQLKTGVRFNASGDRNNTEANGSSIRGGAGLPESLNSKLPANRIGLWVQNQFTINNLWRLQPGLRFDWSGANQRSTVSPRVTVLFTASPSTNLKFAAGRYTQSPGYEKLVQSDFFLDLQEKQVENLLHQRSDHLILGIERKLSNGVSTRIETFYKTFEDMIVGRLETEAERLARIERYNFPSDLQGSIPTNAIITSNPSNDARGNAYGFDIFVEKSAVEPSTRLTGWLSYTYSHAERNAYERTYAFDYDRRHSLNFVGAFRLSRSWSLAWTSRVASGFPYTPALGVRVAATQNPSSPFQFIPQMNDIGLLIYEPDLGGIENLNTGRLPYYSRQDFRVSWQPGGPNGNLEIFVEAINALNRENAIRLEPTLEYDSGSTTPKVNEKADQGFPLLPSFGIRWRF